MTPEPAPRPDPPRDETRRDKQRIEAAETARDPLWAPREPEMSKWWGDEREFGEPGAF